MAEMASADGAAVRHRSQNWQRAHCAGAALGGCGAAARSSPASGPLRDHRRHVLPTRRPTVRNCTREGECTGGPAVPGSLPPSPGTRRRPRRGSRHTELHHPAVSQRPGNSRRRSRDLTLITNQMPTRGQCMRWHSTSPHAQAAAVKTIVCVHRAGRGAIARSAGSSCRACFWSRTAAGVLPWVARWCEQPM